MTIQDNCSILKIIPAKAGHEVKFFSVIQVDSRSWFLRMPDDVRHDGEL
jgi:hypothetical protein